MIINTAKLERALKIAGSFWRGLISIGTLATAVGTLAIAVSMFRQIGDLEITLDTQDRVLRANASGALYQHGFNVVKHYADNPEIYELFYGSSTTKETIELTKLALASEITADLLAHVILQRKYIDEEYTELWENYVRDEYKNSLVLRDFLHKHPGWYQELIKVIKAPEAMKTDQDSDGNKENKLMVTDTDAVP